VSWDHFSQQELDDELIEQEAQCHLASIAYNQTLNVFKQFVGQLATIRCGFFLEGVFYVLEIDSPWYRDFESVAFLGDLPDEADAELEGDEIEREGGLSVAEAFDTTLRSLKKIAGKKDHLRKVTGARDYKSRRDDVTSDADTPRALPHKKPAKGTKKHLQ
jgi:hypothetical protein